MNPDINWHSILQGLMHFAAQNAVGIGLSIAVIFGVGRGIVVLGRRIFQDEEKQLLLTKWVRYITVLATLLWIIILYNSYTGNNRPFYLFLLGLVLAGIAISLRDVFSNFVGWLVIISAKGFKSGDRIKIGDIKGDVIDIGLLRTVLAEIGDWVGADQSTGRLISLPNSKILANEVLNYTQGFDFIWHEQKILVTFESDWEKAEEILNDIATHDFDQKKEQLQDRLKNVRQRYLLRYNYITPKVFVRIADSGVELALRYMVRVRRRRTVEDNLSRLILEQFGKHTDIDFAYPTMRIYRANEPELPSRK